MSKTQFDVHPLPPNPALLGEALHALAASLSKKAAVDSVQAPRALSYPLTQRARRHMRSARVSWW